VCHVRRESVRSCPGLGGEYIRKFAAANGAFSKELVSRPRPVRGFYQNIYSIRQRALRNSSLFFPATQIYKMKTTPKMLQQHIDSRRADPFRRTISIPTKKAAKQLGRDRSGTRPGALWLRKKKRAPHSRRNALCSYTSGAINASMGHLHFQYANF